MKGFLFFFFPFGDQQAVELPSLHGLGGCPQSPVPVCLPSALFSHPQVVELPSLHEAFGGKGDPARLSAACLCAPRVHTFSSPVAGPLHSAFFFWFRRWCVKGFFFFFWWQSVGSVVPSRSLLPGSACRSMWCSRPVFIRVGGLSRARRGTDIHGEWRPLFSFCQRAPRLSSPPLTGGVWKAGVRSLRHEPCESPPALPAVVRGGSREARQGLRRLPPLARFAPPTVCGPCGPPPSEPGEGWPMCAASHALPERALCARVSLAILAVLLERSRPIFRGARY